MESGSVSPPLFFSVTFIPHLCLCLVCLLAQQGKKKSKALITRVKSLPPPKKTLFIAQSNKNTAFVMVLASVLRRWPWPTSEGLSYGSMTSINAHSNEKAPSMIGCGGFFGMNVRNLLAVIYYYFLNGCTALNIWVFACTSFPLRILWIHAEQLQKVPIQTFKLSKCLFVRRMENKYDERHNSRSLRHVFHSSRLREK